MDPETRNVFGVAAGLVLLAGLILGWLSMAWILTRG